LPGWTEPDDERPLTDFGKKEVRQVAKFLNRLKVEPDLIVTSPLPRALQTAEVAAEQLKTKLRQDEALEPGFGISRVEDCAQAASLKSFDAVGHEPDFSSVISALSGACLKLSKAGVRWSTSIRRLKQEDFFGCSRRNSRASEIGFLAINCCRSCSRRRTANHLARFCTKRPAGPWLRTKYP